MTQFVVALLQMAPNGNDQDANLMHTTDFDLEGACTPGDEFYVAALDTGRGTLEVGAMICFDREFPESARILMLKGAEVIPVPNGELRGSEGERALSRLRRYSLRSRRQLAGDDADRSRRRGRHLPRLI